MRVYLDNCCYNRPFDEQEQMSVRLEATAKLHIQAAIRAGVYDLVWSYMNEYENNDNPYDDRRESIQVWEQIATEHCEPSDLILRRGQEIQQQKIRQKDALNLACAIESGCAYFITTDKPLLKKRTLFDSIIIINPIDFVRRMEEQNAKNNQL
jgi:predicted nucleic acid-binding protein